MSSLNIIILTEDAERFRGALTFALAHTALGGKARLFLQLDAVRLLAPPVLAPQDDAHAAHGMPRLATLLEEALESGVAVVACQSGLALGDMSLTALDPRIEAGGPVSFLQSSGVDRLLIA